MPYGLRMKKPSDHLGKVVAQLLTKPSETRSRITRLAFHDDIPNCPVGRVEAAFHKIYAVESLEKKVLHAVKEGQLKSMTFLKQIEEAQDKGILTTTEASWLAEAELARQYVIAVDDFMPEELVRPKQTKVC